MNSGLQWAGGVIILDCHNSLLHILVNRDRRSTCRWKIKKKKEEEAEETPIRKALPPALPQKSQAPLKVSLKFE